MKKIILNADDFAKSIEHNNAIVDASRYGFLKSASIMASMPYFDDAVNKINLLNDDFSLGVHLNIIEGCSIVPGLNLLCDSCNNFNKNYLQLLLLSSNKNFLQQVELEFRSQIEKCIMNFSVTHIDSHVHVHSIPNIFKLVVKLAKEYNINYVRTQHESLYFVKNKKYNPINLAKVAILNYFTHFNKSILRTAKISTNDYILGVNYTGSMDKNSIISGLECIKSNTLTEILIHPKKYDNNHYDPHSIEYELSKDIELKNKIIDMGFEISSYNSNK